MYATVFGDVLLHPKAVLRVNFEEVDSNLGRVGLWLRIVHIKEDRNTEFAQIITGVDLSSQPSIDIDLPNTAIEGVYLISDLCVDFPADPISGMPDRVSIIREPQYFRIVDDLEIVRPSIEDELNEIECRRLNYINHTISLSAGEQSRMYSCYVFCSGGLLHNVQQMKGIRIVPCGRGLHYGSLLEAVNFFTRGYLHRVVEGSSDELERYSANTPIYTVEFISVAAEHADTVASYALEHVGKINNIIGAQLQHQPEIFCCIVYDDMGQEALRKFFFSNYTGNLAPPFGYDETSSMVENLLPKVEGNALGNFLLSYYGEAMREKDINFRFMRLWSIIEQVATAKVPEGIQLVDRNGNFLRNKKGHKIGGRAKHARVYEYILKDGWSDVVFSRNFNNTEKDIFITASQEEHPGSESLTLYNVVEAAAFIRGEIAHHGTFRRSEFSDADEVAALSLRLYGKNEGIIYRLVCDLAWKSLINVLNRKNFAEYWPDLGSPASD